MRKQSYIKMVIAGAAVLTLNCGVTGAGTEAADIQEDSTQAITIDSEEYSDMIATISTKYIWKYKKKDGKTYRRLYDATHSKWVGDWIEC